MGRMTTEEIAHAREAVEQVPRMPSYASRALSRLRYEMRLALEQEAKLRGALSDIKTAIHDVDPWKDAPPL